MKKKQEKKIVDPEAFNRFGLKHKDHEGNTFYIMQGKQICQNPKFKGLGSDVLAAYREHIK